MVKYETYEESGNIWRDDGQEISKIDERIRPQIEEAQQIPKQLNTKNTTLRQLSSNFWRPNEGEFSKVVREKLHIIYEKKN